MSKADLYNLDAEQALLGAILRRNEALALCDPLRPEDFFEPVHARIFEAAAAMIRVGRNADAVTLQMQFRGDGTLQEIGGIAYLGRLAAAATTIVNAPSYAGVVRDLSMRREAMRIAQTALEELPELPVDQGADEYIAGVISDFTKLGESTGTRRTTFDTIAVTTAAIDEASAAYQNHGKRPDSVPSGLAALDSIIGGLTRGTLTVAGARPSMGKTALGVAISLNAARANIPVLLISLEMAMPEIGHRLLAIATGIPFDRIKRGDFSEAEYSRLCGARDRISKAPITIDDRDRATAADLSALVARAIFKRPTSGLVVINYLGLISPTERYRGRKVDELGEITTELKRCAKRHNVAILLLAQLNRGREGRENKRPTLADLRDSGSIEQDADVVIFPYRPEYYLQRALDAAKPGSADELDVHDQLQACAGIMELIVAKNRQGRIGTVRVHCEMATNCIEDASSSGARAAG